MMKKIIALITILVAGVLGSFAQSGIAAAEYFFDTDPGIGNGIQIAVSPADTLTINMSFPVSSLSKGRHLFCFRTKDNLGNWGHAVATPFVVEPKGTQVSSAEYFFDTDPGFGNGTPVTLTAADTAQGILSLPATTTANGRHLFCLRTKDNSGNWSLASTAMISVEPKATSVIKGEYYFDSDPGMGNGIAFNFAAVDSFSNSFSLPLPAIATGLHNLCFRVKDNAGAWTFQTCSFIHVVAPNNACTDVEYYFDTDPGLGNGTLLNLNLSADTINLSNMSVPVPLSTSVGTHYLFIRAKNNGSIFSLAQIDTFDVTFNPVPVNLLNFMVKKLNQQAMLSWATAQEVNNRGFEVQRSTDGTNFFAIGFVQGNGTTAGLSNYQFIDVMPVTGKNFYRLRQIDYDNSSRLSEIRRIDFGNDKTPVVYPNPFSNTIQVLNVVDQTRYNITNAQGQIMMQGRLSGNQLNTSGLAKGIYMLCLMGSDREMVKLVKN